jgi:hypothetical protein
MKNEKTNNEEINFEELSESDLEKISAGAIVPVSDTNVTVDIPASREILSYTVQRLTTRYLNYYMVMIECLDANDISGYLRIFNYLATRKDSNTVATCQALRCLIQ